MTDNFTPCPTGYYCLAGQKDPTICPQGTYNPTTHATVATHCLECPPGKWCGSEGLAAPSGDCDAGYFCSRRVIEKAPAEQDTAETVPRWGPCPLGHYCPAATAYPYKCPIGKYNAVVNQDEETDCQNCDAGYYGETTGLTASTCTGKCAAGFYCLAGSTTHSPESGRCREGTYCPEGTGVTDDSMRCPAGTYNPLKGQGRYSTEYECIPCPEGSFCIEGDPANTATHTPQICEVGHYCEARTGTQDGTDCAAGTYQPEQGRHRCLKCPPGHFCSSPGKTSISSADYCAAGYRCGNSATTSQPQAVTSGDICKAGSYCDAGSAFETPCPPGFACPSNGLDSATVTDAVTKTYFCQEGHYCSGGATTTTPFSAAQGGGECPAGYYCPGPPTETSGTSGTHVPLACPPGTYRADTGGTTTASCTACPANNYCKDYGSTSYSVCDQGWFCTGSNTSPTPDGGFCPVGHYCTGGLKTACPVEAGATPGTY